MRITIEEGVLQDGGPYLVTFIVVSTLTASVCSILGRVDDRILVIESCVSLIANALLSERQRIPQGLPRGLRRYDSVHWSVLWMTCFITMMRNTDVGQGLLGVAGCVRERLSSPRLKTGVLERIVGCEDTRNGWTRFHR